MFYLFNVMPSWAKVVRGDVRPQGRRNFLGMSPWMTFSKTLKRRQWREGQVDPVPQGKGTFSQSSGYLSFPTEPSLVGTTGRFSYPLPLCFCCWVIEETTKPAERTLILDCWFVCLVLESAMKIWGKLRKNKAKIFPGKTKNPPTSETHAVS